MLDGQAVDLGAIDGVTKSYIKDYILVEQQSTNNISESHYIFKASPIFLIKLAPSLRYLASLAFSTWSTREGHVSTACFVY